MKTMFGSMTGVAALGVLMLAAGCDDSGFIGSTLPPPSGTGGASSTGGAGVLDGGTGGSSDGRGGHVGGSGGEGTGSGGEGGYGGEGGGSGGEGGYGGEGGGSGGYGGEGGGSGGEGGYSGSGGSGGYAGDPGLGGDGAVGGQGGYAGDPGVGGYGGEGERIVPCPTPGRANTPVTVDAFRAAVTRKWVSCLADPVGGERGDALGAHDEGIEIKADGRYWHIARNQAGDLEGVTGVESEGTITFGFTDFGAVQTTFRSDLNQILVAAPVITADPTLLIIRTGDADHRYVPADGS